MNTTNSTPFFSVIIPLYNKAKQIKATLESALNQSFKDFEIIIIDDGSTDNSVDVVSLFKDDRIFVYSQQNNGASAARNYGINKARGEYMALLDADDSWYENHLYELKKSITHFPNAGLFCNNYEIFFSEDLVQPAHLNFNYSKDCLIVDDFFKASTTNSVAWTSAVGFTKEIFNALSGFNTKLKTAQDLDLWIKMALNYSVAFNPTITMSYKLHIDNSLSKNEYNDIRYGFINSYKKEEASNPSLKLYLDINRYALAIRCLINNEDAIYKKVKNEIDYKNLNFKQKLLLSCPKPLLIFSKKIHSSLIKNGYYFSAFK